MPPIPPQVSPRAAAAAPVDPALAVREGQAMPAFLWSLDGERLLWANRAGRALLQVLPPGPDGVVLRAPDVAQAARLAGGPGQSRLDRLRLGALGALKPITCRTMRFGVAGGFGLLVEALDAPKPRAPAPEAAVGTGSGGGVAAEPAVAAAAVSGLAAVGEPAEAETGVAGGGVAVATGVLAGLGLAGGVVRAVAGTPPTEAETAAVAAPAEAVVSVEAAEDRPAADAGAGQAAAEPVLRPGPSNVLAWFGAGAAARPVEGVTVEAEPVSASVPEGAVGPTPDPVASPAQVLEPVAGSPAEPVGASVGEPVVGSGAANLLAWFGAGAAAQPARPVERVTLETEPVSASVAEGVVGRTPDPVASPAQVLEPVVGSPAEPVGASVGEPVAGSGAANLLAWFGGGAAARPSGLVEPVTVEADPVAVSVPEPVVAPVPEAVGSPAPVSERVDMSRPQPVAAKPVEPGAEVGAATLLAWFGGAAPVKVDRPTATAAVPVVEAVPAVSGQAAPAAPLGPDLHGWWLMEHGGEDAGAPGMPGPAASAPVSVAAATMPDPLPAVASVAAASAAAPDGLPLPADVRAAAPAVPVAVASTPDPVPALAGGAVASGATPDALSPPEDGVAGRDLPAPAEAEEPPAAVVVAASVRRPMTVPTRPLRFVWQADANATITRLDPAWLDLVGDAVGPGGSLAVLAADPAVDPVGALLRALDRRETFAALRVNWPVEGFEGGIGVDLAGSPVIGRDRVFLGFTGFGMARDVARLQAIAAARSAVPVSAPPAVAGIVDDQVPAAAEAVMPGAAGLAAMAGMAAVAGMPAAAAALASAVTGSVPEGDAAVAPAPVLAGLPDGGDVAAEVDGSREVAPDDGERLEALAEAFPYDGFAPVADDRLEAGDPDEVDASDVEADAGVLSEATSGADLSALTMLTDATCGELQDAVPAVTAAGATSLEAAHGTVSGAMVALTAVPEATSGAVQDVTSAVTTAGGVSLEAVHDTVSGGIATLTAVPEAVSAVVQEAVPAVTTAGDASLEAVHDTVSGGVAALTAVPEAVSAVVQEAVPAVTPADADTAGSVRESLGDSLAAFTGMPAAASDIVGDVAAVPGPAAAAGVIAAVTAGLGAVAAAAGPSTAQPAAVELAGDAAASVEPDAPHADAAEGDPSVADEAVDGSDGLGPIGAALVRAMSPAAGASVPGPTDALPAAPRFALDLRASESDGATRESPVPLHAIEIDLPAEALARREAAATDAATTDDVVWREPAAEAERPVFPVAPPDPAVVELRRPAGDRAHLTSVEQRAFDEIARTLGVRQATGTAAPDASTGAISGQPAAQPETPADAGDPSDAARLKGLGVGGLVAGLASVVAAKFGAGTPPSAEAIALPKLPPATPLRLAEPAPARDPEPPAADRTAAEAVAGGAAQAAPPVPSAFAIAPNGERALLERMPVGVLVVRLGEPIYANRAFLDWTGYGGIAQLAAAGGLDRLFQRPQGAGETRAVHLTTRDGETFTVDARLFSTVWEGDTALALVALRRDEIAPVRAAAMPPVLAVDERLTEAEKRVHEATTRARELAAVLDTATDGVVVIDGNGIVLDLNRSAEALFGYDAAEIEGRPFTNLFAPESHRAAIDYLDGLTANGVASVLNDGREVLGRVREGGLIPLFMSMGRIADSPVKLACVFRDISQWKRAEEDLVAAKRHAERASHQKSDFLAKISHEIRTPLNAIIGFSEVMMEERFGPVGNERYREYMKDIHTSGGHLLSLINDLLDLSKIEAGKLDLTFTGVKLNDLVQQCVAIMQPQAARERIVIRPSLALNLPPVVADARTVRQIVLNLLSNSIKFTPPGGHVIVTTALTDLKEAVIRVRDTGVGMSEKDIATAMEPFRQLATSGVGGSGGTGLGLPLTKALAEANRASFSIRSTPGDGTLVEVVFPANRVLAE